MLVFSFTSSEKTCMQILFLFKGIFFLSSINFIPYCYKVIYMVLFLVISVVDNHHGFKKRPLHSVKAVG